MSNIFCNICAKEFRSFSVCAKMNKIIKALRVFANDVIYRSTTTYSELFESNESTQNKDQTKIRMIFATFLLCLVVAGKIYLWEALNMLTVLSSQSFVKFFIYANFITQIEIGCDVVCNENGKNQSPIRIETKNKVFHNATYGPFPEFPKSLGLYNVIMRNNEHSVQINTKDSSRLILPTNWPLKGKTYQFTQIHFHWGVNDTSGSEHQIGDSE